MVQFSLESCPAKLLFNCVLFLLNCPLPAINIERFLVWNNLYGGTWNTIGLRLKSIIGALCIVTKCFILKLKGFRNSVKQNNDLIILANILPRTLIIYCFLAHDLYTAYQFRTIWQTIKWFYRCTYLYNKW